MKEQKQRRKVTQACENCRKKRVKCTGEKPSCQKCRDGNITCHYKPITKKRGPRSGFLDDMVNNRVKRILLDSHIPYNTEQVTTKLLGTSDTDGFSQVKKEQSFVLVDDHGKPIDNDSLKMKNDYGSEKPNYWSTFSLGGNSLNNKANSEYSTADSDSSLNINKIVKEMWPQTDSYDSYNTPNINGTNNNNSIGGCKAGFNELYNSKYLKNQDIITKSAPFSFESIVSLDELTQKVIPINFQYTEMDEVKSPDQLLIESKSQTLPNTIHIDYNLLTDYFNYAHAYNPIVHPTLLVRRIQQRTLSPGLLLVIYAMTYLLRPSSNMKLAKFYASKARQYFMAHINTSDIQNIHTCYLLANFEPGTNRSYLFSGIAVRLLKVLNLYDEPKDNIDPIAYEERIKTLWCCLSKDSLMNISSNRMEHPGWLDQPLPQEITDSAMLQYYTPKRLTIIFMAIVMCLIKIIEHSRNRRKGVYDIEEFHKLDNELLNLRKHIEKHISLSKKSFSKNTYPQLACIIYVYLIYFSSKIVLYNLELSPFIYKSTILKTRVKRYVQMNNMKDNINDSLNEKQHSQHSQHPQHPQHSQQQSQYPFYAIHQQRQQQQHINNENKNFLNDDIEDSNSSGCSINSVNFKKNCILAKIPSTSSNYILVDKIKDNNNNGNGFSQGIPSNSGSGSNGSNSNNSNNNSNNLEIPEFPKDFDYESCYKKAFESAEEATNAIKLLVQTIHKPYIRYQNPLCWSFYHIGLFYMTIYVNMRKSEVKETIDFYYEQIRSMMEYYPYIGRHYTKLYEDARNEAEIAFNDNDILFCPKGYY